MIFSPRLKEILKLLLEADKPVPANELAEKLKTSRRTIFRELEGADQQLAAWNVHLESTGRRGYSLAGPAQARQSLKNDLAAEDVAYVSKAERQMLLAFELLQSPQVQKLIYYASMFQVSEATISNDLDALSEFFGSHHIQLSHPSRNSIVIEASEKDRRQAMSDLIHQSYLDENLAAGKSPDLRQTIRSENPNLTGLLDETILNTVCRVFESQAHELGLDKYAKSSWPGLVLHLVIAIERIEEGKPLASLSMSARIQDDPVWDDARKLCSQLERKLDVTIPEEEAAFIAIHMKASKKAYSSSVSGSQASLEDVVDKMILAYDPITAYRLSHDEKYIEGLILHLEPALLRMKEGLPIYNPLLGSLKVQYPELWTQSEKAARVLEEMMDVHVSDAEIGFLTMHAGGSLERQSSYSPKRKLRVGIACASGIGISVLLSARVKKNFSGRIQIQTLGIQELNADLLSSFDLIISNLPLKTGPVPFIQVSALLNEGDVRRLEAKIFELENEDNKLLADADNFQERLQFMNEASQSAASLISGFETVYVPESIDSATLISMAASRAPGKSEVIEQDLLAREKLGSVISDEYGFVMFHAVTSGTALPVFKVLYPHKGHFESGNLKGLSFAVLSLLPRPYLKVQQEMLSMISVALIEDEIFYQAILLRDANAISMRLNTILHDYIYKKI